MCFLVFIVVVIWCLKNFNLPNNSIEWHTFRLDRIKKCIDIFERYDKVYPLMSDVIRKINLQEK